MMWSRRALVSFTFVLVFFFQICVVIAEKQHDVSLSGLSPIEIEEKLQVSAPIAFLELQEANY
jgi:hypothetical protein